MGFELLSVFLGRPAFDAVLPCRWRIRTIRTGHSMKGTRHDDQLEGTMIRGMPKKSKYIASDGVHFTHVQQGFYF